MRWKASWNTMIPSIQSLDTKGTEQAMRKKEPFLGRLRKSQKTIVLFFELLLILSVFFTFYFSYRAQAFQLKTLTRVTAITVPVFAVVFLVMISVYGGYQVGKRWPTEIIYSVSISAVIADIAGFAALSVMIKDIASFYVLITVVFLQILQVWLITKAAFRIYFYINPPSRCALVYGDKCRAKQHIYKIMKCKKQYTLTCAVKYTDPLVWDFIEQNETVFISDVPSLEKQELMRFSYEKDISIYVIPSFYDVIMNNAKHELLGDTSVLACYAADLTFEQRLVKRLFDVIISGVALLIFSPIMLLEALFIKLEDKGPVLFRQERLTLGGRTFSVYKFRTMVVNAEEMGSPQLSSKGDPRITKVGRILRAARLDELPQLINIFLGEMSVVGPRPEREEIANEYQRGIPEFKYRLKVKGGLTGLAQVMGKYNTSAKDKLMLDLLYIHKYSIWLDIKILFQTLRVLFDKSSSEGFEHEDENIFVASACPENEKKES